MDELRSIWLLAEQLGFEWISVWDHFLPMLRNDDRGSFEGIATQAALAEATTRPRIGSLVYSTGYRHPMVLANAMATIDHISGGRMELGLGAGWCPPEYAAFGVPFEGPVTRLRRLKEATEVIRLLWTNDSLDYDGEFFQLQGSHVHAPLQEHPRIWLGVMGEQHALQVAAEVADGWNCPSVTPAQFAHKREILMAAAADPTAITTSVGVNLIFTDGTGDVDDQIKKRMGASALRFYKDWSPTGGRATDGTMTGSVDQVTQTTGEYIDAGADWVILRLMAPFHLADLTTFATEVMPQFTTVQAGAGSAR